MAIVALGVVYGDIGTSPLYTMQTFLNGQGGLAHTDRAAVLGILSLVFWSITLITTVKYVFIAMRIDNNGEGGIFALYSLIRKYGAWLAIPAMLGGAAGMDAATRVADVLKNPSMLLALMWYKCTSGKGLKDMVILPYKDRLLLFSRYLQQLIMESLGKELDLSLIHI